MYVMGPEAAKSRRPTAHELAEMCRLLEVGMPADIIVYDLEKLELGPTERAYDYPAGEWRLVQLAKGYHWTLINAEVTFIGNACTGVTAGELLRHGMAA